MKTTIFTFLKIFFFLFVSFSSLYSQVAYNHQIDSIVNLISLQSISKFNRELSGDTSTIIGEQPYTIISRYYEHEGNEKAAQYIYEKFQSFGLATRYQTYRTNGVNVIAEKTGTKYPNQQFIVCAHYDDGPLLNPPYSDTIPGADDNASGVSAVLEAAKILNSFNFDYTLIFIAFDEEEIGGFGSKAYSDSAFANNDSIVGVINLDMIAWDSNNDQIYQVTTDSNSVMLADDMVSASLLYQPNLVPIKDMGMYSSDQLEFWRNGFVAIAPHEYLGDFNPYYHTVYDLFSNLNLQYFMSITKAVVSAFASLGRDYKINFEHTPFENSGDTTDRIATVVINSPYQIAAGPNAPRLYYKIGTGQFTSINAFYNNLDTFKFSIPGHPIGSKVSYYIAAQDSTENLVGTFPCGGKGFNPPGNISPATFFTYNIFALHNQCSNTLPKPILDGQTTYDTIHVSQGGTIEDVNVNLTLEHTCDGDISISINGPVGVPINLSSFNGGSGQNYTNTTFDDEAPIPITQASPPFTGSFSPEQYLSYLDGKPINGFWILKIFDNKIGDQGTLLNWCVDVLYSNPISIIANSYPVDSELHQNYPNPFNPKTKINMEIAKLGEVKLIVYDILGREVATLVNEELKPGTYEVEFDGSNYASGVYFYKLITMPDSRQANDFSETKKMLLLK